MTNSLGPTLNAGAARVALRGCGEAADVVLAGGWEQSQPPKFFLSPGRSNNFVSQIRTRDMKSTATTHDHNLKGVTRVSARSVTYLPSPNNR